MALKLIGAVGIKVRPEAEHFRDEAERDIKRQMRDGMDVPTRVRPEMDKDQLKRDFDRHKKAMQRELDRMSDGLSFNPFKNSPKDPYASDYQKLVGRYKKSLRELTREVREARKSFDSFQPGKWFGQNMKTLSREFDRGKKSVRDFSWEMNDAFRQTRNWMGLQKSIGSRLQRNGFTEVAQSAREMNNETRKTVSILDQVGKTLSRVGRNNLKAELGDTTGEFTRAYIAARKFRREWDKLDERDRKVLSVKLQIDDNNEIEKAEDSFRRFNDQLKDLNARDLLKQMKQIRGLTERERWAMADEWNQRLEQMKRVKAGWEQINSTRGNQNRDNERIRREYEDNLRHVRKKAEETKDYIDDLEANIHVGVDGEHAAAAQMKWLTRPRRAMVHAVVSKKSLVIAEGLLNSIAGVHALKSLGEGLERIITDFDKFSIKAAGWTTLIGSISNAAISGAAALFSIGDGLVRIVGLGAMAPTMFGALGTSILVATTSLKDFFSALKSGDTSGLLENARKEVEAVKGTWTELSDTIKEGFWSNAGNNFSGFILDAMPSLKRGLGEVAEAMGKSWDNIFGALRHATDMGYLDSMFDGLSQGLENASEMMGPLTRGIMRLGARGSEYLPQFGDWLAEIGQGFENWINKADEAGDINRWIEDGTQAVKDLGNVTKGTARMLSGLSEAALAAGGPSLGDLASGMLKVGDAMHSAKGQFITREIFAGAIEGWGLLADGLGDFFGAIGDNIGFVKELEIASGRLGGTLFTNLSKVLRNKDFTSGVTQGFHDIGDALEDLEPSFTNMGTILGDMSRLTGAVFKGITPTINAATDTISSFVHELRGPVTDLIPRLTAGMGAIIDLVDTPIQGGGKLISGLIDGFNKMPAPLQTAALSLAGLLAMRPQIRGFGDAIMNRVVPATSRFGLAMNKLQAEHLNAGKNISKTTAAYRTFKQEMAASSRVAQQSLRGMGRDLSDVNRRLNEHRVAGGRAFNKVGNSAKEAKNQVIDQTGAYNRLVKEQHRLTAGMREASFATTRFGSAFSALDRAFGGQTRFTEVGNGLVRMGEGFRSVGRSATTGLTTATTALGDFSRSAMRINRNPIRFDSMFQGLNGAARQAKRGLGQIATGAGNAAKAIGVTAGAGLRRAAGGLMGALGGPWGLALTGAAVGVGMFAQSSAEAKQRVDEYKQSLNQSTGAQTAATKQLAANRAAQELNAVGFIGLGESAIEMGERMGLSAETVSSAFAGNQSAIDETKAAMDRYRKSSDFRWLDNDRLGDFTKEMEKSGKEADEASKQVKQIADAMGITDAQAGRLKNTWESWSASVESGAISGKQMVSVLDEMTGGMVSGQDAAFNYQNSLAGMKEALSGWSENYGGGIKDISKTLEKNNGILDMTKKSHRDLYGILRSQIEPAYNQVADAFNRAGGGEKGRAAAAKSMSGIRDDWMSMLTDQVGMTDEAAGNMLDALNINPDAIEMVLESGGVEDKLDEISNSLKIISGEKTIAEVQAEIKNKPLLDSFKARLKEIDGTKSEAELSANAQDLFDKLHNADGKLKVFATQEYLAKLAAKDNVSGIANMVQALLESGFNNKTYEATLKALDEASDVADGVRDKIMAAVVNQDFEAAIKLAKDANIDGDLDGLIEKLQELDSQSATPGINEPQGAAAAQCIITNLGADLTGLDNTSAMPLLGVTDDATGPISDVKGNAEGYAGTEYSGYLYMQDYASDQVAQVGRMISSLAERDNMIPVSANTTPAVAALSGLQGVLYGIIGNQYMIPVGANTTPAVAALSGLKGTLVSVINGNYVATVRANTTPAVAAVAGLKGTLVSMVSGNYTAVIRANTTPAVAAASGLRGVLHSLVGGNYTAVLRANTTPAVAAASGLKGVLRSVVGANYTARINANASGAVQAAHQARSAILNVIRGHYMAHINGEANRVLQAANQARSALYSVPRSTHVTIQAAVYGTYAVWSLRNAIASVRSKTVTVRVRTVGRVAYNNGGIAEAFADGGFSGLPSNGFQNPLRNRAIKTIEHHTAQIAPAGANRVWAEPETGGEAYIPLSKTKRTRSEKILGQVADRFGMSLERNNDNGKSQGSAPAAVATAPAKGDTYNINVESVPTHLSDEVSSSLMFDLKHMKRGGYPGGPH